jgi:signal peptidase I
MELKLFIIGCIVFGIAMIMKIFEKHCKTETSKELFQNVYSWVDTIWTSLIIASFIMFFFIQAFKVPTGSMRNTILEGDHMFVNKVFYGFRVPFKYVGKRYWALKKIERGDIVVFQCPLDALTPDEKARGIKKDFVKRCIGIAGDKIEIKEKKLYINDVFINEVYVIHGDEKVFSNIKLFEDQKDYQKSWESGKFSVVSPTFIRDNFGPVVVPEGCYMVMGDNRDYSFDSRFWGPLHDENIKGKAMFLYWPITRWRFIS